MGDVQDIKPGVRVESLIDDHYIECRIDQLLRECDAIGLIASVVLVKDDLPCIYPSGTAFENRTQLVGALARCQTQLEIENGEIIFVKDEDSNE